MRYRDEDDYYDGLSRSMEDWCTCNCDVTKHWTKHYASSYSEYGWSPEEWDCGCKGCDDCPSEDRKRCDNCGEWKNTDEIFFIEETKDHYCATCRDESRL